jgi:hypothetical protein
MHNFCAFCGQSQIQRHESLILHIVRAVRRKRTADSVRASLRSAYYKEHRSAYGSAQDII